MDLRCKEAPKELLERAIMVFETQWKKQVFKIKETYYRFAAVILPPFPVSPYVNQYCIRLRYLTICSSSLGMVTFVLRCRLATITRRLFRVFPKVHYFRVHEDTDSSPQLTSYNLQPTTCPGDTKRSGTHTKYTY